MSSKLIINWSRYMRIIRITIGFLSIKKKIFIDLKHSSPYSRHHTVFFLITFLQSTDLSSSKIWPSIFNFRLLLWVMTSKYCMRAKAFLFNKALWWAGAYDPQWYLRFCLILGIPCNTKMFLMRLELDGSKW